MATLTLILFGVGIYMAIMIAVGLYASRKTHSLTDFVVAGRKMPLWLCSISIFSTWFGSGIMMGAATAAYEGGHPADDWRAIRFGIGPGK